jgi:cytochrome c oxidase assembly protein subunit 15
VKDNLELIKFRKSLIVTIVITYLLIMVGALVRSTGSGMGCPDWPKCFGQYIPPTNISQLPTNYKEIFKVEGKTIADFNAFHTWVEYLNRLLGVVVGFVILAMVYFAFPIRKTHRKVWLSTLFSLFLVLFIGWVGSKVVSSNLAPIKISIHMILALALSFVLVGTYYLTSNITAIEKIKEINAKPFFNYYFLIC